jgi:hypothetical protein
MQQNLSSFKIEKKFILDLRLDCCNTLRGVYTSDRVAIVAGVDLKKKDGVWVKQRPHFPLVSAAEMAIGKLS